MVKIKIILTACLFFSFSSLQINAQTPKKLKTIIVDAGHGGTDGGAHGGYEDGLNSYEKNVTLAISLKLVEELKKQLPGVNVIPTRTTDIYQSPREKADIANDNKGDLFICIHADAAALKTGSRVIGHKMVTVYDSKVEWVKKGKKKVKKVIRIPREVEKPIIEYFKEPTKRSGTSIWLFAAHKTNDKLKAIMGNEEIQFETQNDSTNTIDFSTPENRMIATVYAKRYQEKSIAIASLINDEIEQTDRAALGINQRQVGIWVLQATRMPAILVETGFITNYDDERYLNSAKGQQEIAECITRAVIKYKKNLENPKQDEVKAVETVTPVTAPPKTATVDYSSRAKNVIKKIEVKQKDFKIELYDDGDIDGDIVSVFYNGKPVLTNKQLTASALVLNLSIDPDVKENELLIYAENEGKIPPNTALMIVNEGSGRNEVRIMADSKKNGVILFSKK